MRGHVSSSGRKRILFKTTLLCSCSAIALATALSFTPAVAAREIGVTSAVRPDVRGTPPERQTRILSVGVDLFANEVIQTSSRGQTHLLFVDGSALTVGPGAELKLDRFVYDPDTKTGELVITASKGLMRFVGGRLSKKNPVIFKTPTAVIGIRGGIAMMQIGDGETTPPSSVTMHYGDQVFMESGGQRQTMNRPGFQLTETPGGGVNPPRQVTQQELTQQLQSLEDPVPGEDGENLGDIAPAAGGGVTDQDVSNSQLDDLGSNNDPNAVGGGNAGGAPQVNSENTNTTQASQRQTLDNANTGSGGAISPVGAPIDNDPATNLVNESAANGTPIGITALAQNVLPGERVTYSLTNNAGGRFAINPVTGVISVLDTSLLDAETTQTFSITVQASKQGDGVASTTFTVTIGDDNTEFLPTVPTDTNAASNSLSSGAAAGTGVNITAFSQDQDVSDTVTFGLNNSAGNRFQINPTTGVVSAGPVATNFKTNRRHTITVQAASQVDQTATADFTVEVLYNGFQGRVKHSGNDASLGSLDGNTNHNRPLQGVVLGFGDLSANVNFGEGGIGNIGIPFPDTAGTAGFFGPTNNWAFGTIENDSDFQSRSVLNSEQTFIYYEIHDTQFSGRALLFAGDPTLSFPGDGVTGYDLTDDFVRNGQALPFLDGAIFNNASNHGSVYLTWGAANASQQNAFGGGLVAINGSGITQRSGMFVLGGSIPSEAPSNHISASLFGQGRQSSTNQPIFYTGGIASSDAGDGSDFFGSGPDAFVLESATVTGADVITSRGINKIENGVTTSEAFYANSVATQKPSSASFGQNRTTQMLNGFATGIELRTDGGANILGTDHVFTQNNSVSNIVIQTSATNDTVQAQFNLEDSAERSIEYVFGSTSPNQGGAFIDDQRFYAVQNSAQVSNNTVTSIHGLVTSDTLVFSSSFLPSGVNICTCEHLVWGFWGARRQDSMGSNNLTTTHLATWVAGSLASSAQVTNSNTTATYSGHMIGNVMMPDDSTPHYVAIGGIDLTFTFNPGNFTLDSVAITNFDGVNFASTSSGGSSFTTNAYNSQTAGLEITGGGRTALLNGAFFAGQASGIPLATGGQGSITGPGSYAARFTFGAQPPAP